MFLATTSVRTLMILKKKKRCWDKCEGIKK